MNNAMFFIAAISLLHSVPTVFAQPADAISIKLTDKSGEVPRTNIRVLYSVKGINVSSPNLTPEDLVENKEELLEDGVLKIPRLVAELEDKSDILKGSRRVRISIEHIARGDEKQLDPVEIDFLVGDKSQDLTVVMMEARIRRAMQIVRAAYHGHRAMFHLTGSSGTALHWYRGSRRLSRLEFYFADANYYYYRDADSPNIRWAFSRKHYMCCSCLRRRCRCASEVSSKVWVRDSTAGKAWRFFEMSPRIEILHTRDVVGFAAPNR